MRYIEDADLDDDEEEGVVMDKVETEEEWDE